MAKKIDSQLGRDYLWNTASSIIGSASMVIMALVVSRFLGGYAAGVFTLATAVFFHNYWAVPADEVMMQTLNFNKNLGIAGGLLAFAAFGAGGLSLDAKRRG